MLHEYIIDFAGGNLFAPTIDDLFKAARDEQIPIDIHKPLVTCPEPPFGEGTFVGRWIVLVALGDVRTSDDNLALVPRWQHIAHVIHYGNLRTRRHAHGTSLPHTGREWITGHLMGSLRHPVGLYHRCLEHPFQRHHHL